MLGFPLQADQGMEGVIFMINYIRKFWLPIASLPAGTQYQNDIVSTSMRRDHVASTLIRRHFNVVCSLGLSLASAWRVAFQGINLAFFVLSWKSGAVELQGFPASFQSPQLLLHSRIAA